MKSTTFVMLSMACACMLAIAEDSSGGNKAHKFAPGEFEARAARSYERKSGGLVRKEGSAQGTFVLLNAQQVVASDAIRQAMAEIEAHVRPISRFVEADSVKLSDPSAEIAKAGGNVGVVVASSPDFPTLLVAPENGWAIVNVAALSSDGPKSDVLAARVRKEIMRGFALAGGCTFNMRGAILLRNDIRSPKALDTITEEEYGVDTMMTLERNLPLYGVMPWKEATYKKACREGWAPAPTNDVQKAIWNEYHELPTKPITIEFDPKKGK